MLDPSQLLGNSKDSMVMRFVAMYPYVLVATSPIPGGVATTTSSSDKVVTTRTATILWKYSPHLLPYLFRDHSTSNLIRS